MPDQPPTPRPARPKRGQYRPRPETLALLKVSGNPINGLGETKPRRPSPFFWHPPDRHPYGELQAAARQSSRKCPGAGPAFQAAYSHPELVPVAEVRNGASAAQLSHALTAFARAHEADGVGIAPMDPLYVFEGYTIDDPWVIVLAIAHDYERLAQVPSDETNGAGVTDIGEQYARGTRASYALANWIRAQGYNARAFPGPMADALLLIPPAIASGLGELGKHGSLISRHFGSGVRLAGVTTDMPLVATAPDVFGADAFCQTCQICTRECPPGAISEHKQMVRGVERWYVDFDKCIPYFAEAASCGICIAVCPWTRPDVRPKLLMTMARRLAGEGHMTVLAPTAPSRQVTVAFRVLLGLAALMAVAFFAIAVVPYANYRADGFGPIPELYWPRRHGLLVHIAGGTVALLLGPVALWLGETRRRLDLHRPIGFTYLGGVTVGTGAAVYLSLTSPVGWIFASGLFGLAVAWTVTTGMAFLAISRRAIAQHREWMIRSYVTTLAFVFFRAFAGGLEAFGVGTPVERASAAAWFCWAVPLLLTEPVLQWRKR